MYKYITKNKGLYVAYIVLMIISSFSGVLFAFVLSSIVDSATGNDLNKLVKVLIFAVCFVLVSCLSGFLYGRVKNKLLFHARNDMKNAMFSGILRRNVREFEDTGSAQYMNEFIGNLGVFENLYWGNMLEMPSVILSFALAVGACVYLEPLMLLIIVVMGTLTAVVVKFTGGRLEKSTNDFVKKQSDYSAELKDDFEGIRLIASYSIFDKIINKHGLSNLALEKSKEKNGNDRDFFIFMNEFIGLFSTVLIMAAAAFFAIKGHFSAGIVIGFGQLAGKIIAPIMSASETWVNFKSARKMAKKYKELTENTKESDAHETVENGDIKLENISFGYSEDKIINHFSQVFESGKKYLIEGESGSGKSTILNLLCGLYRDYDGKILLGSNEISETDSDSLSNVVSLVSQNVFLFSDTLRNNITLYGDYSDDKVNVVVKQCGLEKLISSLEDGLETMVTENGSNFSGGEKQRINIARALLKDTPVMLFDEVTANLDPATTEFIENKILSLENKTVISVSHKMPQELADKYDIKICL